MSPFFFATGTQKKETAAAKEEEEAGCCWANQKIEHASWLYLALGLKKGFWQHRLVGCAGVGFKATIGTRCGCSLFSPIF